jgi:nitrate reductase cytochrome c-type subunit
MPLSTLVRSISPPASSEPSKKRRRAISTAEKTEIRKYYLDKSHNKRPTLNALQTWYHEKHPHLPIAISSLSEIASSKYECLDVDTTAKKRITGAIRLRGTTYSDLSVRSHHNGCTVRTTGTAPNRPFWASRRYQTEGSIRTVL